MSDRLRNRKLRRNSARAARPRAGRNLAVRAVAGSLMLSAVLGTFSVINAPRASAFVIAQDESASKVARPPVIYLKPFKDQLARAKELLESGAIRPDATLDVSFEADRNTDGTLSNIVVSGAGGDEKLRQLALDFVQTLSDSRVLGMLEDSKHLSMTLRADQQTVAVSGIAEVVSEKRAQEMAIGYGALVYVAGFSKRDKIEGVVLNNMRFSSSGKQLRLMLVLPRETVGNLLLKSIAPN